MSSDYEHAVPNTDSSIKPLQDHELSGEETLVTDASSAVITQAAMHSTVELSTPDLVFKDSETPEKPDLPTRSTDVTDQDVKAEPFTDFESKPERDKILSSIVERFKSHRKVRVAVMRMGTPKGDVYDESDGVGYYLKGIGQYPLLTKEDEVRLFSTIERGLALFKATGNEADVTKEKEQTFIDLAIAHEQIYLSNLRLVASIAKRFRAYEPVIPYLDLISEGNAGLLSAISRFNVSKGFKFSTYATWWIQQSITRAIVNQSRMIRLPLHMSETVRAIKHLALDLEMARGRPVTFQEIGEAASMDRGRVEELFIYDQMQLPSLDKPASDESETTLGELKGDGNAIEQKFGQFEDRELILGMIEELNLDYRSKVILSLRTGIRLDGLDYYILDGPDGPEGYGTIFDRLAAGTGLTLEEIGIMFGITRERVRQIQEKTFNRLVASSKLAKYQ